MEEPKFDREKLKELIQEASLKYKNLSRLNQFLSLGVGLLGISLSLGATISGVMTQDSRIAAIFGACAATSQAILFAYPVEKRAAIYRILTAKNSNLEDELEIWQQTDAELRRILEEFKSIRLEAALEEASPGKVEEAVEKLSHDSLNSKTGQAPSSPNSETAAELTSG